MKFLVVLFISLILGAIVVSQLAPKPHYTLICKLAGKEVFRSTPSRWRPDYVYKQGNVWVTADGNYTPQGGELCNVYTVRVLGEAD